MPCGERRPVAEPFYYSCAPHLLQNSASSETGAPHCGQALRAALDGWNREQDAQAAGELLFAAANAMRLAGVDAEEALTFASKRYCAELLAQKEQSGTQVE